MGSHGVDVPPVHPHANRAACAQSIQFVQLHRPFAQ
jgi:hypothetical protein